MHTNIWELTRAEYVGERPVEPESFRYPYLERIARERPDDLTAQDLSLLERARVSRRERAKYLRQQKRFVQRSNAHYYAVIDAHSAGLPVPAIVLADFPHLISKDAA